MVTGVNDGFEKKLAIQGVGYPRRHAGQGSQAVARLQPRSRLSRPPRASPSPRRRQTEVVITGIDKQQVGQVAANIRAYRKPEPYKGKGVRYVGEYIARKEGKKK